MKLRHTADIHLGAKTYGRRDPDTGFNTRLLDEDVATFLFCGDADHTADPTPTQ